MIQEIRGTLISLRKQTLAIYKSCMCFLFKISGPSRRTDLCDMGVKRKLTTWLYFELMIMSQDVGINDKTACDEGGKVTLAVMRWCGPQVMSPPSSLYITPIHHGSTLVCAMTIFHPPYAPTRIWVWSSWFWGSCFRVSSEDAGLA